MRGRFGRVAPFAVFTQGRIASAMRLHATAGGVLALALLIGCVDAAGDTKAGLQPGALCVPFEPLNVTGAFAGEKRCLV
jgi:hypothetical protein